MNRNIAIFCTVLLLTGVSCENTRRCTSVTITKGPYVLYVSHDGAEIRWETPEKGCAVITVADASGAFKKEFEGKAQKYEPVYDWEYSSEFTGVTHVWNYIVKVEGLDPGRRYFYSVKGDIEKKSYSFRTAPLPGETFKFAVIGDTLNMGDGFAGNMQVIKNFAPDIVLHTGDLQYYSYLLLDSWIKFFSGWEFVLTQSVFLPSRGNHESELQGELINYFNRYFRYSDSLTTPYYYYVRYGSGLFVILDSEATTQEKEEQIRWFEDIAGQFTVEVTRGFIAVVFHRPPYTLSEHFPNTELINLWHPVFKKYPVKMVFNGHNHVYERFVVDGINYIVTGGGGAPLYDADVQLYKLNSGQLSGAQKTLIETIYPLRVTGVSKFNTVLAEVYPEKVSFRAVDHLGEIIEEFVINY